MAETKQTRKTPLTTIGISQELAERLDNLLTNQYQGMKRKDFVEGAITYFERTGYPLNVDQIDHTPLERLADRLEKSAAIIANSSQEQEQISQFFMDLNQRFLDFQQQQLALPSSADITAANKAKATAESELTLANQKLKTAQKDNDRLCDEIKQLKEKLKKLEDAERLLTMAKTELQHCKGLFSSANNQVLKELGIE